MVVIMENLSGIIAGSPMVWTTINSVQRLLSPGLIKDPWIVLLACYISILAA